MEPPRAKFGTMAMMGTAIDDGKGGNGKSVMAMVMAKVMAPVTGDKEEVVSVFSSTFFVHGQCGDGKPVKAVGKVARMKANDGLEAPGREDRRRVMVKGNERGVTGKGENGWGWRPLNGDRAEERTMMASVNREEGMWLWAADDSGGFLGPFWVGGFERPNREVFPHG